MNPITLPFIRPVMPPADEWASFLAPSFEQGFFSNFAPVEQQLTREMWQYFIGETNNARKIVLASSATSGLIACLQAIARPREQVRYVVIPSFTFAATAQSVIAAGYEPLFCEVTADSWEMCPLALDDLLAQHGKEIAAIMPVRCFGFGRDFTSLVQRGKQWDIPVIIDAAAALGSKLPHGQMAGLQADAEVFSLHVTKSFGIGEGGAVFAHVAHEAAIKRHLNFAIAPEDLVGFGVNGKMSDIQAAVGIAVLRRFSRMLAHRQYVAQHYESALGWLAEAKHAALAHHTQDAAWQFFPLLLNPEMDVAAFVSRAASHGLQLRRYYRPAIHSTTAFRRFVRPGQDFSRTEMLANQMVGLPIYADMSEAEQRQVIDIIGQCFAGSAASVHRKSFA